MDHLTSTLTINIDPMFKYCLKCYASENKTTISDLVRQYMLEGFKDNEWRSDYDYFIQERYYREHPEEFQIYFDEMNKIIEAQKEESEKQQ